MSDTARARVLIADDEDSIRFVLRESLEERGHEVIAVDNGQTALEALASGRFEIAFVDVRMPGLSGIELLAQAKTLGLETSIVVITAQNTFENAVEAMKLGALDYLVKPFRIAEVTALVEKAERTRALEREVRALRREVGRGGASRDPLIGKSAAMIEIFKTIGRVARSDVAVLITGESGTGKELVARAIHAASPRAHGPLVAVNSSAVPRDLLESELFGHERGAFTGAVQSRAGRFREADGGTMLLDEIGDMPVELQTKLLRVLQSGEVTPVGGKGSERVDVRILASTHRDLDAAARAGTFREDLLYRLRVVPLHIPPLRERRGDVRVLAEHFLDRYAVELGAGARWFTRAALERLTAHDWPGNVRELENAVKRALVLSASEVLAPEDFAFLDAGARGESPGMGLPQLVRTEVEAALDDPDVADVHRRVLDRVERPLLEAVLERTGGNQIRAAALLGINRNTLRKKIVELGVRHPGRS